MPNTHSYSSLRRYRFLVIPALALSLAACSTPGEERSGPRYEASQPAQDSLEIPPNLLAPRMGQSFQVPETPGERVSVRDLASADAARPGELTARILPENPEVRLLRDRDVRWLWVAAEPEALWPRLREFWREQNLILARDEPLVGIMETEWAEDRAGIPLRATQGLLSRLVGTIYDAGTRDQYRARVERHDGGTEIFISHRGAVEASGESGRGSRWVMGDSNPELEVEMLNRLMVFLTQGASPATPLTAAVEDFDRSGQVDLVERAGQLALIATGQPDTMWRRLGLALERTGLLIDEQDQRNGVFLVTYRPDMVTDAEQPPGPLRRLFGGREDPRKNARYQLRLDSDQQELAITVAAVDGEPLNERDTRFVLELIQPQLR